LQSNYGVISSLTMLSDKLNNSDYVLVPRSSLNSTTSVASSPAGSSSSSQSSSTSSSTTAVQPSLAKVPMSRSSPFSRGSESKEGFRTILNYLGTSAFKSTADNSQTSCKANDCGEFSSFALLFQYYRVDKVVLTLDTHMLTNVYTSLDPTTASNLTGFTAGHVLSPGYLPVESNANLEYVLDVPKAKLIDYGSSKNVFKLSTPAVCHNASSGSSIGPTKMFQECSQVNSHIWATYVLQKYPTTYPRNVLVPIRVQFYCTFKNRK